MQYRPRARPIAVQASGRIAGSPQTDGMRREGRTPAARRSPPLVLAVGRTAVRYADFHVLEVVGNAGIAQTKKEVRLCWATNGKRRRGTGPALFHQAVDGLRRCTSGGVSSRGVGDRAVKVIQPRQSVSQPLPSGVVLPLPGQAVPVPLQSPHGHRRELARDHQPGRPATSGPSSTALRGFLSGLHASPLQGFSFEFSQHRKYSPGVNARTPLAPSTPKPGSST